MAEKGKLLQYVDLDCKNETQALAKEDQGQKQKTKGKAHSSGTSNATTPSGLGQNDAQGGGWKNLRAQHQLGLKQTMRTRIRWRGLAVEEYKVKQHVAQSIVPKFNPSWKWAHNYQCTDKGRIWLLWNPNAADITITHTREQFLNGKVTLANVNMEFQFTTVYGQHTL
ncbi:hypothetical protein HAX54_046254 [Datura stramonium]|uniref:Uncharacterized protein n=1 Tax=Datura stramonium TaxID=4076 RepID=A0ABS8SRX3_DATST|nr:hypothetical protein [Datura stramonium]